MQTRGGFEKEFASVRLLFQRSGKNQTEFARACGLSVGTITNLLDAVKGSIPTFMKVAKAHGLSYDAFLDLTAEKPELEPLRADSQTKQEDIGMKDLLIEVLKLKEMVRDMRDDLKSHIEKMHSIPFANSGK